MLLTILDRLLKYKDIIVDILSVYQPKCVSFYEIDRCIHTLKNIEINYNDNKVNIITSITPSNLPLYSLFLFVIIPSFQSHKIYCRPNTLIRNLKIIDQILSLLYPEGNLYIIDCEIQYLNEKYISISDVVIFTGSPKIKNKIINNLPNNSLFLSNGGGHNPIVISSDANLNKAVKDSSFTKFFNSGQDCAGPDNIFVHKNIIEQFTNNFLNEISNYNVGCLKDENSFVSKISRTTELVKFVNIIHKNREKVIYGGNLDIKNSILYPTVIRSHITDLYNTEEIFGPIAFIIQYDNDEELSLYFKDNDGFYQSNKMYVTLYGTSDFVLSNQDSPEKNNGIGVLLHNICIHDWETGDKEYGGYNANASLVLIKKEGKMIKHARPIYIPREIDNFLNIIKTNEKDINYTKQKI